jgi:hypothetical protein
MNRQKYQSSISVPNAFSYWHFIPVLLTKTEYVRPDRMAYYSFSTHKELLQRHELQISENYTCTYTERSTAIKRLLKRAVDTTVMHTFSQFSEGLMIVVEVT